MLNKGDKSDKIICWDKFHVGVHARTRISMRARVEINFKTKLADAPLNGV
jgi:RNA pol II promoter Fmp27 protein domain